MALEIGKVVDGTVTGITNFGAFIQLPDGNTGLCHISEIADEYVKNVKDYLKEQQVVKVKIIETNGKGKVSLSIRKAIDPEVKKAERKPEYQKNEGRPKYNKPQNDQGSRNYGSKPQGSKSYGSKPYGSRPQGGSKPYGSRSHGSKSHGSKMQGGGFEDMLSKFMKDSDEKLKTMKKSASNRRGNGFNRSGE
ncbi:S1 RNA-binding domain-containing protein [Wukongibacter baidiensis]|uniref:S1 RNA-binding domain-containing protein n=1 Tax=Wukongibacter baidiensis TaxID=1723361 RepID=UPI003D7F6707